MPPPRSYIPIRRPGARAPWPPDDSWAIADLVAELQFWRSYAALRPFTVARDVTAAQVQVPAQRTASHQAERDLEQRLAAYRTAQARDARRVHNPHLR